MGGIAAAIGWSDPPNPEDFDRMCSAMTHRAAAGLRVANRGAGSLGEGRLARDGDGTWDIESLGPLSIVGDIRLWGRDRLEAVAGASSNTRTASDRTLLLAAYRRRGAAMMDAVDGDFAFVIWDEENRIVVAARDRFGIKPLFVHRSAIGIQFASEPKQLTAFTGKGAEPSPAGVVQYLTARFFKDTSTAIEGIDRVPPAHIIVASGTSFSQTRYWDVRNANATDVGASDVPELFREHLIDSVSRRLAGSKRAVSQLSGGLDSSSITASASVLSQRGLEHSRLVTVSALFPGTNTDESEWIDPIVADQPFEHVEFEHQNRDIAAYVSDMKRIDAPMALVTGDLITRTGQIARDAGADLVLTGHGGDDVAGDSWLLADTMRSVGWAAWGRSLRAIANDSTLFAASRGVHSLRLATPDNAKAPVRRIRGMRVKNEDTPITEDLADVLSRLETSEAMPNPRSGIDALERDAPSGLSFRSMEHQDALFATYGLEVSHPYFDRGLVDFVAGLAPSSRPIGSRNKALVRNGFRDHLPQSVLSRRTKTHATSVVQNEYLRSLPLFVARFPEIAESAEAYIDGTKYASLIAAAGSRTEAPRDVSSLWRVWTFMLWLDAGRDDPQTVR